MSLRPHAIEPIPELTARIAKAAFPKGTLYVQMRDELGTLFTDEDFTAVYPRRGKPALAPWRLALVTVMQFVENLSDRQAAEAVRARIDWKYALSLKLDDAGFDFSLLSEFRDRLLTANAEHLLLDRMLDLLRDKKLLKARGRQRTDSTHVLAAIRAMNRLELVIETLRATLNELAQQEPDWLRVLAPPEWYARYTLRAEEFRLPQGDKARRDYAEQVGRDGAMLLAALKQHKPERLTLPCIQTLQQVWKCHYVCSEDGTTQWRPESQLPRAATTIESPYDPQARYSTKRDLAWTGYKVHVTETCDPELPHLVTNVHTTVATTQDVSCTAVIQERLAQKKLLPTRHLVDAGYVDAELLVSSRQQHEIELFGPPRAGNTWQEHEGGYSQAQFVVDWEKQQVTCPQGKTSTLWRVEMQERYEQETVRARFSRRDCSPCPCRALCVRSKAGNARSLRIRPQLQQEALQQMRRHIGTQGGLKEYNKRAGIEGTLSQGVRRHGLRHTRYIGLAKTHLQHLATAAALNLGRVGEYLREKSLAQTRTSRFARLAA